MKTLTAIRKAFFITAPVVILPLLMLAQGVSAQAAFLLSDDASGGDCTLAGTWEAATRTCVLTSDIYLPVEVLSNGVILHGNGHSLIGAGGADAIRITGLEGVAVTNLTIEGFSNGIVLNQATGCILEGNTVRGLGNGIWLNGYSQQNLVMGNTLEANLYGVQISWYAHDNVVESNLFKANWTGLNLGYTYRNEVVNNVFLDNTVPLTRREFYNVVEENYWSDFDTPAEGCVDADTDGFCDEPYLLGYGADPRPACAVDVDTTPPAVYVEATPAILVHSREGRMEEVLVNGFARDSKSGVAGLVITLTDEYGDYDQVVAGFGSVVTLKAKADPKDTDGRVYLITATATDVKGNTASATTMIVVPYKSE